MSKKTCKEKIEYGLSTLGLVLRLAVKAVKENYGEQGLKKLSEAFQQAGMELGKNEMARLKIKENDAVAYHKIVGEALKAFDVKHEVVKFDKTNYVLRIYECPHAKNFVIPEACDIFLDLDKGIVQSINPALEFKLTKHILRGDPYCEYVVTSKGG
ncbi:MAG: L-2-amino-thiazoline-4-carboxylic acid hydrolase [Candidatus Bathyarchaeia archaeon]